MSESLAAFSNAMEASPVSSDFAFAPSSGLGEFARQYNLGAVTGKESELIVRIAVRPN
jgi:hypothetical protein